jgi:hypothetical protein
MILGREPAQWTGLISAALILLVGLGLPWSEAQTDTVQVFVSALAAVVAGLATRPLHISLVQQFAKAAVAVAVVFGADIGIPLQTAILAFIETAYNFAMRPSVSPAERITP